MRVYLRSKGGLVEGWGHMIRSARLAQHLAHQGRCEVLLAIEGPDTQWPVPSVCIENVAHETEQLMRFSPDAIVLDMLQISAAELERFDQHCKKLILFNDLGNNYSLGDIIIMPQYLEHYPIARHGQQQFIGSDYFILSQSIRDAAAKEKWIRPNANRLLVILGGAVRKEIFIQVHAALQLVPAQMLEIDFILGIQSDFQPASDRIRYHTGNEDLGPLMHQADLALSSSGYVKYELAAVGTPSLLLSIVEHQHGLGAHFAKRTGCADYLGPLKLLEPQTIADAILALANDTEARETMSRLGRDLVDGQALQRISEEIQQ